MDRKINEEFQRCGICNGNIPNMVYVKCPIDPCKACAGGIHLLMIQIIKNCEVPRQEKHTGSIKM